MTLHIGQGRCAEGSNLMKISILLAAMLCFPASPQASVTKPEKALVIELTIPASTDAVWEAFSTSAGLSTWLTPNATVDLRPGGEWTARFPGGSNGGGTIISFVPEKELVVSALAPEKFPTVRATR